MVQASGGDVDLIRATISLVGERRPTRLTESSKRAGISFVSKRLAGFPFEIGAFYDSPSHGLRSGRATAILTMTICGHARFALYPESNFPAVTSAGDHLIISS
jgi:hypothetical protein